MKSFIIAIKDFKIRIKDRKAIIMMLLMPVLLTAILGSALKGALGDSSNLPKSTVGVYLQDNDPLSSRFIDTVLQDEKVKKTVKIKKATSEKQLNKWVKDEKIDVGMVIPKKWSEQINQNKENPVRIFPATGKELEAVFIQQVTESFAKTAQTISVSTNAIITDLSSQAALKNSNVDMKKVSGDLIANMDKTMSNGGGFIKDEPIGDKTVSSMQYYAAAMAAMFLLFNAMHGGKSILNEKSTETLARIMTSPTGKGSLLMGKFFGTLLFAFIQFLVFMEATHLFLHVDWGNNLLQTLVLAFVYSIAVSGLSMIVAAFTSTEKMADTVGGIGVQILALLGGSMLPITVFPSVLRKISLITPNSWALTSFTNIMSGTSWISLIIPICTLLIIGFVSIFIGTWKLRTN